MLFSDIKILILEDSEDDIKLIKEGLLKLEKDGRSKLNEKFIFDYHIKNKELNVDTIYKEFKERIVHYEIDVIFIDLNLLKSYEDGLNIIKNLIEDEPKLKHIPKYILSSQNVKNIEFFKEVEQFTNLFIQKPENEKTYEECFIDANLVQTLPTLVDMYTEVKKSFETKSILENIKYQLDNIEINTDTIKQRINLIESMNQTMIKLFPLSIDDKKKEELRKFIKDDMSKYLEFDEDNFFPEEEDRQKFVEAVSKQFDEMVKVGLRKDMWDNLKEGIKEVAKTQGIDDDNAGLCAVKLVYRGYSEVTRIARGEA